MNRQSDNAKRHITLQLCIFIGLCFLWTGSEYLTWLYHLMNCAPDWNADMLSEVFGYLFQVAGLLLYALLIRKKEDYSDSIPVFVIVFIADFLAFIAGSTLSNPAMILVFGYIMNLLHGIIAGIYICLLVRFVCKNKRGIVFGLGYAIGTLSTWLLSLPTSDNFLTSRYILLVYALFIAISIVFGIHILHHTVPADDAEDVETQGKPDEETQKTNNAYSILALVCVLVLLFSLTKGLGFYFPMADISSKKVSLEFSRIFYSIGLILAGILNDKSRKYGLIACTTSLVFPYISLLLIHQADSAFIVWILSYLFAGFYSVYRVIVLSDLAEDTGMMWIAGFGLLFGRIGDAAGSAVGIALMSHVVPIILICTVLFVITIVLTYAAFEKLYMVKPAETIRYIPSTNESNENRLQMFIDKYSLSNREAEVLALALTKKTNTQISEELFISDNTIKFHIRNILKKTGCANRNELKQLYANETSTT